ncbi:MAG: alanine racemase [Pseudomonadota bacterium]
MPTDRAFAAHATIDLTALRHNLEIFRHARPGCPVMAMVKANAYGHGLIPVAHALHDVDSLAVARLSEASVLRDAGVRQPLVLLEGVFTAAEWQQAVALDCEIVIHTEEQLALMRAARTQPRVVWVKVNSGMNRLGFAPEGFAEVVSAVRSVSSDIEIRLMSHFADADREDSDLSARQLERLEPILEHWTGAVSLENSPACLTRLAQDLLKRAPRQIWLRPGIGLYGAASLVGNDADSESRLRAAMTFKARIIAVQMLSPGERVGYGGRFVADREMRIGVVAAGYGDGYPRMMPDGAPVLVDGAESQIVGRVSMDMLTVDLTSRPSSGFGSEVILWGRTPSAHRLAAEIGTIGYELVTRVSDRVDRIYLGELPPAGQVR